jgi:hypothetical protein
MSIEERIAHDAGQWREGHIAPPFDAAVERALAAPAHRRGAWLAAAAAFVLIGAIAAFVATRSSPQHSNKPTAPSDRWTTRSLAGLATVQVPARWFATRYRGAPATVYFPLVFFSTQKLTGPCFASRAPSRCTSQSWFPASSTTPTHGVLVLWSHAEFPTASSGIPNLPGRRVVIDHRAAKVSSGAATTSCPTGATTEIDAYVRARVHGYPGERFDMTACLGAQVSPADRDAVQRMLRSLHIRPA